MQAGFAMLTAGSVRAKNAKNVVLTHLLNSCGGGLAFWATGYAFAYGGDDDGGTTYIGSSGFFLQSDGILFQDFFFQFAFASLIASIVAGAVAERCTMTASLFYSTTLVGFCYPVVAHSFWSSNGWLSNSAADPIWSSGVIDIAGCGPVHMTGGVTALVAAIILGPRLGRFYDSDGAILATPKDFPPHSVVLQFLGTFCLWFGWYGFNPGAVLEISTAEKGQVAALVAVNTTLAACGGALSAMLASSLLSLRRYVVTC
jgi:ammonium transporter, Amt family